MACYDRPVVDGLEFLLKSAKKEGRLSAAFQSIDCGSAEGA
jgi:hypothetical protein